mmetsp:Transcript_19486/g.41709  ORF Transcript_19486/g.41709 Transcript_19486/m.41709 type:complete len:85 (-) Transcript_19486:24-278(-)
MIMLTPLQRRKMLHLHHLERGKMRHKNEEVKSVGKNASQTLREMELRMIVRKIDDYDGSLMSMDGDFMDIRFALVPYIINMMDT